MRANEKKIDAAPLAGTSAKITDQRELHREVAVSRWSIDRASVTYQKPDSHTLSLYMSGGDTSFRRDLAGQKGHKGALCLMPQDHLSRWHIGGEIHFSHLYFSDTFFRQFASDLYDRDVRLFELKDLTYEPDERLRMMMSAYLALCQTEAPDTELLEEQTLLAIFNHLIENHNAFNPKLSPIRGGLSPTNIRRMKEAITTGLGNPLSITGLADQVGLSPYHFARQFKVSFGESPAQYINRRRIEAVKKLLASDMELALIASKTGFAQQSHMTTLFKRHTGITPNVYRGGLKN